MKKLFLLLIAAFICLVGKAQMSIPTQEIHYNVNYHWGLVDVMIARGTVSVSADGYNFYGTLDGTSIPWEGKIICVSDTLQANMTPIGVDFHETVIYQNGWYRHVPVSNFRSNTYNPDDPAYFRNIAGQGNYDASQNSMEAITVTSDMLSMYYFAHVLNYSSMQPGHTYVINIDGPYSRQLMITYQGEGTYYVNGDTYPTYNCTFEYGYDGSMSGYPVECKIGVSSRILMYLSASLPVGHVEMLYDPY